MIWQTINSGSGRSYLITIVQIGLVPSYPKGPDNRHPSFREADYGHPGFDRGMQYPRHRAADRRLPRYDPVMVPETDYGGL